MKTKQFIYGKGIALFILILLFQNSFSQLKQNTNQIEARQIDNNLTVYLGGGGNSGILVADSAVVVIDTKMGTAAENLFNLAREKAGKKKIIVINTHYHGDHTKGNMFYKGSKIYIGNYDKSFLEKNVDHENMPTDFVIKDLKLNLGDETVQIYNLGQAHTFQDVIVYLENRRVLFSGDLVFNRINPYLKKESRANVDDWILALNAILMGWEINTLVPGHGAPGTKEIAIHMREYLEDMQDAAANPEKADQLKSKYKNWVEIPDMTSPEKTIEYIKENK
jgi:glyoxylase-like metal-dependent hydrolase (beta-lactamase superfamily II)